MHERHSRVRAACGARTAPAASKAASRHVAVRVQEDAQRDAGPTRGETGPEEGSVLRRCERCGSLSRKPLTTEATSANQTPVCRLSAHEQRHFVQPSDLYAAVPHAQRQLDEERRGEQGGQQQQPRPTPEPRSGSS